MLTLAGLLIEAEYQLNFVEVYAGLFFVDCLVVVALWDILSKKRRNNLR